MSPAILVEKLRCKLYRKEKKGIWHAVNYAQEDSFCQMSWKETFVNSFLTWLKRTTRWNLRKEALEPEEKIRVITKQLLMVLSWHRSLPFDNLLSVLQGSFLHKFQITETTYWATPLNCQYELSSYSASRCFLEISCPLYHD